MAFAGRVVNALRRTSVSSNPSLLQAVRCMSSKLFVGGLSYATDDTTLKDVFSHYGDVLEARIIIDRDTGKSKGYGFITYTSSEEAAAAVTAMDGKDLQGRIVRVSTANDRAGGIRRGGGFGAGGYGSGGGYSSGGGYGTGEYGRGGGYAGNGGYGGRASEYGGYGAGGYSSSGGYNATSVLHGNAGGYGSSGVSHGNAGDYRSSDVYNTTNTYGAGNFSHSGQSGGSFGGNNGGISGG
ncbi:hypothetical protein EE612_040503 [Oryza sativa]|nr:hypothetical protein EE612_040503 [Oryza sativa]